MLQNTRATPLSVGRQGRSWNVSASGKASMSDSSRRAKPSIDEPSKPMPSSNASSSSSGEMANDFSVPSTSVNHRRTKRMSRSSTVRRTKSMSFSVLMGLLPTQAARAQVLLNHFYVPTTVFRAPFTFPSGGIMTWETCWGNHSGPYLANYPALGCAGLSSASLARRSMSSAARQCPPV